ncbi:hypothetical protein QVD17_16317 [Tagetes erecta]|uniref:Uncharacterized protein n=1 Tax=Tagetes erecta TaxID=13708 RepID=A0AAD8KUY3_TARER|nr:hypothetical protein QVD17_16317 [Tagetes erecta]
MIVIVTSKASYSATWRSHNHPPHLYGSGYYPLINRPIFTQLADPIYSPSSPKSPIFFVIGQSPQTILIFSGLILQMHTILDEMILDGQVVETNSETLMQAVEEISKQSLSLSLSLLQTMQMTIKQCCKTTSQVIATRLEKITAATKLISKSASLLWG